MADDLIQRLRAPTGFFGQNSEEGYETFDDLSLQAADRLASLQSEVERLTKERDAFKNAADDFAFRFNEQYEQRKRLAAELKEARRWLKLVATDAEERGAPGMARSIRDYLSGAAQ